MPISARSYKLLFGSEGKDQGLFSSVCPSGSTHIVFIEQTHSGKLYWTLLKIYNSKLLEDNNVLYLEILCGTKYIAL